MASKGAHKQSRFAVATAVAALLCLLAAFPVAALAVNAGGTQSAGGATTPATTGGSTTTKSSASSPHVTSVRITSVSCVPIAHCSGNSHQVSTHGTLLLGGVGLTPGMVVGFPKAPGARISSVSPAAHLRYAIAGRPGDGLIVTVPKNAHSGHIMILLSGKRYTSSYGPIYVYNHALHPPAPKCCRPLVRSTGAVAGSPFESQGMWIWYLNKSDGGIDRIDRRASACGRCQHAVHQELRRIDQLLEPVLATAGRRTARQRAESLRLAVRVWHRTRR